MRKIKVIILLSTFFLIHGYSQAADGRGGTLKSQEELSEEDMEIIRNLDFLEDMDLLKEDLDILEDYEDIDQSESIGEDDE